MLSLLSLADTMDNDGGDWARAVSVATDGAPTMIGKIAGVVAKLKEKVHDADGVLGLWTFHCIIHEEAVCFKSLKMEHVMEVVNTANFMRARGLNHRQFHNLLINEGANHGLPYHAEARWLSRFYSIEALF